MNLRNTTGSAWRAMRSEIASGRRRRPCPRLATPDLTGTHDTTRKERFDYAVISDHSIRRCGVAITEMVGGDRV